jgi:hypothetical protein
VILAFVRDFAAPLDAPEFNASLEQYGHEGTRALMLNGHRLRLAERNVISMRMLVPLGPIESVLCSSMSPQEKTVAIAEYLDSHDAVGTGRDAVFNLLLTSCFLQTLAGWRLRELLQGADDQRSPLSPF